MVNRIRALKIANDFLGDKNLIITAFAESNLSFIFDYRYKTIKNGHVMYKPLIDNTMIEVDKSTGTATNYIITEHLKELSQLKFIKIQDAK